MRRTPVVLSIDIGTSSTRAGLFDVAGMPHGTGAQRSNVLRTDVHGKAVLDAAELVAGVVAGIDEVLAAHADVEILGVGISCFWHGLLGVDAAGRPTTDILTWADRRAGAVAEAQRNDPAGSNALHARTGCPAHSSFWTAKLPWLRATDPQAWAATSRWLSPVDHLVATFFGDARTSISMASGTGLFDIASMTWHAGAMAVAGVAAAELAPLDDAPRVGLVRAFADRWPRLDPVPWFPAIGDGACSNIGVGGIDRDTLVLMLGTSGSMRRVWDVADGAPLGLLDDAGTWCYRVDARRVAGGMALSEGGASAAWGRSNVNPVFGSGSGSGSGSSDGAAAATIDLDAQIEAMHPDAHGLTVLPYVLGARSPDWTDGRTACIAGITAATTAAQIQRAMLESVGMSFAILKRRLDVTVPAARRIVVTGGALTRSRAWRQIVADCIGQDVELSDTDEASLRGAALLALERLGLGRLDDFDFRCVERVRFDPAAHAAYEAACARRQRLDAALQAWATP